MSAKRFLMICAIAILLALGLLQAWNALASSTFLWRKHTFGNAGGRLQGSNLTLNGTLGQPSVAGEMSGSTLRLRAGYWPDAGLGQPRPPVVTISPNGVAAHLSWPAVTMDLTGQSVTVAKYQVWRSEQPHFAPAGAPYAEVTAPAFDDPGVLADTAHNYSYVVRAVSSADVASADSNRVAEFSFGLMPGL